MLDDLLAKGLQRSATRESWHPGQRATYARQQSLMSHESRMSHMSAGAIKEQTRKHLDRLYIDSVQNRWAWTLICRCTGSVFPRAMIVAFPSVFIVISLRILYDRTGWTIPDLGGSQIWTGYNSALAFLIIFRTQKAYSRWWEGGSLLQQVRGEWYSAASNLIAFCSSDIKKKRDVRIFQHLLIRIMSLLYCSALQQVAMMEDDCFEIIDTEGVDDASLQYLKMSPNRCEVLISWLQRLVVENCESGVLSVAPPLLTRVYQELSRGYVDLNNVKKIREFPFPFPYAQLITLMLLLHWVITPVASAFLVENIFWAGTLAFITIFTFWCINYIAEEIEMPFGDDLNDLPIAHMQKEMNRSLHTLLLKGSQRPPHFSFKRSIHVKNRLSKMSSLRDYVLAVENFANAWPSETDVPEDELKARRSKQMIDIADDLSESDTDIAEKTSLIQSSIDSGQSMPAAEIHDPQLYMVTGISASTDRSIRGAAKPTGVDEATVVRKASVKSLHMVAGESLASQTESDMQRKKAPSKQSFEVMKKESDECTIVHSDEVAANALKASPLVRAHDYDWQMAIALNVVAPEEPELSLYDREAGLAPKLRSLSPEEFFEGERTYFGPRLTQEAKPSVSCISI